VPNVCRYAWDVISEWQSRLGGDLGARLATVPPQVCHITPLDRAYSLMHRSRTSRQPRLCCRHGRIPMWSVQTSQFVALTLVSWQQAQGVLPPWQHVLTTRCMHSANVSSTWDAGRADALLGGALQGVHGAAAGAAARGWHGGLRRHRSGSCMTQLQGKHAHSEGSDGCAAGCRA
jgi:hypothetical protein